jgi:hypothetical protein
VDHKAALVTLALVLIILIVEVLADTR